VFSVIPLYQTGFLKKFEFFGRRSLIFLALKKSKNPSPKTAGFVK
jgi:hypothetical protein